MHERPPEQPDLSPRSAHPGPPRVHEAVAPLLSFVGGLVDTSGFLLLAGVFLAHITGNFVVLGAGLDDIGSRWSLVANAVVLPLFIAGIALGWYVARRLEQRALRAIVWGEFACLVVAGCFGLLAAREPAIAPACRAGLFLFGVLAMALQTTFSHTAELPMTTMMTVNSTRLTFAALDAWKRREPMAPSVRRGMSLILAFALGAIAAGLAIPWLGSGVLLVAALPIAGVALLLPRENLIRV